MVIVDSPPLGAGFDAFAIATATANMLLVMRPGTTDRKMAAAKLAQMDTLPVRVMGAVVNGITLTGDYEYYSYYRDYQPEGEDEEEAAAVAVEPPSRLAPGARAAAAAVRVDPPGGEPAWR